MKKKAFTLIELLIVIAIIGVLAAALYPTIRDALSRGRDAAREGDINNIVTALETYNSDYGTYPLAAGTGGCVTGADNGVFTTPPAWTTSVAADYFKGGTPPMDPSPNRTIEVADDIDGCVAAGQYYYQHIASSGAEFVVATVMETDLKNNSSIDPSTFNGSDDFTAGDLKYFMRIL